MVDFVRKIKPEQPMQTPIPAPTVDMSPVADAINDQTLALVEAVQSMIDQKQPSKRWVFKIIRDGAGDLKQVIAECEDT